MKDGEHYLEQPLVDVEAKKSNIKALSLKEDNTSFFETVSNGINTIMGSGVLLFPYALASGGWLSLILLFVISISATYTSILIKRCMETNPTIKTYSNIGEFAFGSIGKIIVSIVLYVDLYIVDTGFLILEGDNLHNLFPTFNITLLGLSLDGKSTFIILFALVLIPTILLNDLSILSYFSALGVLSSILILCSILWVGIFDGIGFHSEKTTLLNWKGIPTSISLYMLSYSSHPVLPTLYTSMKNKTNFSTALLVCFSLSTIIYVLIAVLGYLMFGSLVASQVTLSLPLGNISSNIAIYTTLITPLAKYALILKPVVIATESWIPMEYKKAYLKYVIGIVLVGTQVVVAVTFPYFGYLMSLAGALLSATASLTIPCLCYLKITSIKETQRPMFVEKVFIWGIVVLSMVIVIFGTYTSLLDILREIM